MLLPQVQQSYLLPTMLPGVQGRPLFPGVGRFLFLKMNNFVYHVVLIKIKKNIVFMLMKTVSFQLFAITNNIYQCHNY